LVNTVSLYRSPIRLVSHAFEETSAYSSQAISRARKKMMAEISLSGDEIIIDDVSYSRNDASTLLDFITEDNWKIHDIIYTHKGLLNFLEKEEFDNDELKKADAYLYHSKFVEAVSPYFAHSFNSVSGKLIKENDFEKSTQLISYQGYILPEHHHEGYQKIRTYLDELNYTLRNLSWEKFIADESILHFIFSDEWKRFINKLPSSFTAQRDELVEQMTGIVLRFQHKATWHYLHQVLVQLKAIETNDFNRSEVERIDKVIYENSRVEGGRKIVSRESDGFNWRNIWWVVWLVLLIIRVATCNSRSNRTSYNSDDFRIIEKAQRSYSKSSLEHSNEKNLIRFFNDLSKKKDLAINYLPQAMKTGDQPFTSFADDFSRTGSEFITITNNTPYNCVVVYFAGGALPGSMYEGAISQTMSTYIKKGDAYTFTIEPGSGGFHFLFGEQWGKLQEEEKLLLFGQSDDNYSRQHSLFIYEYFDNQKLIKQKYLQRSVFIESAAVPRNEALFLYHNKPKTSSTEKGTDIMVVEKNGLFSIEAKGQLSVKEHRKNQLETVDEVEDDVKIVEETVPLNNQ
jgi:hypothetical protein